MTPPLRLPSPLSIIIENKGARYGRNDGEGGGEGRDCGDVGEGEGGRDGKLVSTQWKGEIITDQTTNQNGIVVQYCVKVITTLPTAHVSDHNYVQVGKVRACTYVPHMYNNLPS